MPYRIDLFAVFIFLGIVQSVFLCFFFFSKENRKVSANVFYGLMLLCMTLCVVEIFLMYTGYIQNMFYLVDFSEPLALMIGPFFYFYVKSIIHGKLQKKNYWHLVFPVVYALLLIPFLLQPEDVKFNSWVSAYDTGLPMRDYDSDCDARFFLLTDYATELVLISLTLYSTLGLIEIIKAFKSKRESFLKPVNPVLKRLRNGIVEVI